MDVNAYILSKRVQPTFSSYTLLTYRVPSPMTRRRFTSAPSVEDLRSIASAEYSSLAYRAPSPVMTRKRYIPTVEDLRDICREGWRRPPRPQDEVYPRIFIGGEAAATDITRLRRLGITHVLNASCFDVYTGEPFYKSRNFKCGYLGIPAVDHESFRLSPFFEEACRFIDGAMSHGGKVMVHCREGISRSATLVLAYLINRKGMPVGDAVRSVRRKRQIYPNDGFLQQLIDLNNQRCCQTKYASYY